MSMIKRSFFGIVKPKLHYARIDEAQAGPVGVQPSGRIRLYVQKPPAAAVFGGLKPGDPVKKGQKIGFVGTNAPYLLAGKSGRIADISTVAGVFGKQCLEVTIALDDESAQVLDDRFKSTSRHPTLENAGELLSGLPGKPDFGVFYNSDRPVKTIVVLGADNDPVSITRQYVLKNQVISIKTGIDCLRKITGVHNVILVAPQHLAQIAGSSGATVKTVDAEFPAAHPHLIQQHVLASEKDVLAGGGLAFFSAEAVSAIGAAYNTGQLPLEKLVTVIVKSGNKHLVSAPIGTAISDILNTLNETIDNGDQVIIGGPMTGISIFSTDHPVLPDTDTLMVLPASRVMESRDTACVNCGECVRVCPAGIQVNLLVRYLEAGLYQEAADLYDLFSCIECGFCGYVCQARIPVFQHIRLAKYNLERMKEMEENNG